MRSFEEVHETYMRIRGGEIDDVMLEKATVEVTSKNDKTESVPAEVFIKLWVCREQGSNLLKGIVSTATCKHNSLRLRSFCYVFSMLL